MIKIYRNPIQDSYIYSLNGILQESHSPVEIADLLQVSVEELDIQELDVLQYQYRNKYGTYFLYEFFIIQNQMHYQLEGVITPLLNLEEIF